MQKFVYVRKKNDSKKNKIFFPRIQRTSGTSGIHFLLPLFTWSAMWTQYIASLFRATFLSVLHFQKSATLKKFPDSIVNSKKTANFTAANRGKMPEWTIGTVSKTVVPLRVPRVRIPVFPQIKSCEPSGLRLFLRLKDSR